MTVAEYIDKLERDAPKNVPLSMLSDAPLVVSRRKAKPPTSIGRRGFIISY